MGLVLRQTSVLSGYWALYQYSIQDVIVFLLFSFEIFYGLSVNFFRIFHRGNFKSPANFDWKKIVDEMKMVVLFRRRHTAMPWQGVENNHPPSPRLRRTSLKRSVFRSQQGFSGIFEDFWICLYKKHFRRLLLWLHPIHISATCRKML